MASEDSSKRERELIRKRGMLKSRLTSFTKALETYTEHGQGDADHLRQRIKKLDEHLEEFGKIQDELELLATDDAFEHRVTERIEFEECHDAALRRARNILAGFHKTDRTARPEENPPVTSHQNVESRLETIAQPTTCMNSAVPSPSTFDFHVKLPTMDLPKFSGSYEAWPGFCDAFKSAVHENPNFHDSQKLMYLRSCLTGRAAEKVESLSTTSANYVVAWDLLEKSYNDPMSVINNRVKALFDLPICAKVNANALGELLDAASKHYRALQATNRPFLEAFPIYAITSKLDQQTRLRWKETIQGNTCPTMDDLLEFLHVRHKVLENSQFDRPIENLDKPHFYKRTADFNRPTAAYSVTKISCHICNDSHYTYQCPKITKINVDQRYEVVRKAGLCINCLRPNHVAKQCNLGTCKQCKARHHTLLHKDPIPTPQVIQANVAALTVTSLPEVLLPTALIHIHNQNGLPQPCRVLLDSGSQSNFLSESVASKLGLKRTKVDVPIVGINHSTSRTNSIVTTYIKSRINNFSSKLHFLILPHITEVLPSQSLTRNDLQIPNNIPLADPEFRNRSQIDGILGAEIFCDLMCVGQLPIPNSTAKLQKTKLGWVVSGRVNIQNQSRKQLCNMSLQPLHVALTKFWEIEEPPRQPMLSIEETASEHNYQQHVTRESTTGKYIVQLPFTDKVNSLGESYHVALRRFRTLEGSFVKNPDLKASYSDFMHEYGRLGHMTKLDNPHSTEGYYLPHHAVIKQSSVTTKLRVVFDASAKTSTGISLNDTLLTGPTIQEDLCSILLRFRSYSFVLTADIEKMYRQILVHPNHRMFQKILWRESPQDRLETYSLNTVTYGTSAAPFLAIRSLHQLARDEGERFPAAATVLREDFYVDDLLTGAQTYNDAKTIRDEIIQLCSKAGFTLRQWASNDERLLDTLNDRTDDTHVRLNLDETVKTLGLQWNARQDNIFYTIPTFDSTRRTTKRTILSQTASLFDPLGLLGPVIIHAKMLIQTLWQLKLDWDESVPIEIQTFWTQFCKELPLLHGLRFERQVTTKDFESVELHGFCDASQRAYGASIYIRTINKTGVVVTNLLCSKSRVAPLKTITIPRLELCAAHLLAKLYKATIAALRRIRFSRIVFWCDSTIVLHWLNTSPHSLKTFVSHRVSDIQALTNNLQWRHITSEDNPADLISRGIKPSELSQNNLWRCGPTWLNQPESTWPTSTLEPIDIPETRPIIAFSVQIVQWDTLEKFSSFQRLKRVIAYCLRFRHNSFHKERLNGPLSVNELQSAEARIIRIMQRERFAKELLSLQSKDTQTNFFSSLNPFIDNDGILRVGGRLRHATLPYNTKHPILLPRDHPVTKSIIRDEHLRNFHAGALATLNAVRQKFWVPNGRTLTRQIIYKCVACHKAKPPVPNYIMGNLPKGRLLQVRPFTHTGVDYCGPIFVKEKVQRNRKKVKVYIAIFVCLSTKAVHIEIVNDLTTEAFLAALRRFFSRRGKCSNIYSDNATNFVGAKREIKELYATIKSGEFNHVITEKLSNDGITWHLTPPRSPHFGGLWEAAVKTTKHHLVRVIGDTLLSYEALLTYVVQIEAILNSRPITPLSSDPNDLKALTPSHFLIGEVLTSIPDTKFTEIPSGRLSMWQHVQQLQQHFWTRWVKEYLQEQTVRKKWHLGKTTDIKVGELVLLREDNIPPMNWPLGRIVTLHPGDDGIVRTATVKTSQGLYKRCVKKLAPLPID